MERTPRKQCVCNIIGKSNSKNSLSIHSMKNAWQHSNPRALETDCNDSKAFSVYHNVKSTIAHFQEDMVCMEMCLCTACFEHLKRMVSKIVSSNFLSGRGRVVECRVAIVIIM